MLGRALHQRLAARASRTTRPSTLHNAPALSFLSFPTVIPHTIRPSSLSVPSLRHYATRKPGSRSTKPASSRTKKAPKTTKSKSGSRSKSKSKRQTKPKKKPALRPKKKTLSPLQKSVARVADLKKRALLDTPKPLPSGPYACFLKAQGSSLPTVGLKGLAAQYKNLAQTELDRYQNIASQNKVANKQEYQRWVSGHSIDEIRLANGARQALTRISKQPAPPGRQKPLTKQYYKIPDDRQLKRHRSPWVLFVAERSASGEFAGRKGQDFLKDLSKEWKSKRPDETKVYRDRAAAFRAQYKEQAKSVYPSMKLS